MTDPQENKLSMYLAVQGRCNAHQNVWSGLQAFVDAFGEFEANIGEIQATRQIQEGQITGVALDKQKEKEEMISKTLQVAGAVFSYASNNNNNELKGKVNYSPSQLKLSRDTVLRDICQVVHDEANKIVGDLGAYGVDATVLSDLQSEIDDFAGLIAGPREAITTKAEATSKLIELFSKGDKIVNDRMDPLTEQFKDSNAAFYKQYHGARIIVDLGSGGTGEGEPVPEPE